MVLKLYKVFPNIRYRCSARLPFIPPYHKIQVDLLLFSNFEDTDPEQLAVDHDVSLLARFYKINGKRGMNPDWYAKGEKWVCSISSSVVTVQYC